MSNGNAVWGYHAEVLCRLNGTPVKIQLAEYETITEMVDSAWKLVNFFREAGVNSFYFAYHCNGALYSIATYKIEYGIVQDTGFYGNSAFSNLVIGDLDISAWDNV